jgi:hypothetical protein
MRDPALVRSALPGFEHVLPVAVEKNQLSARDEDDVRTFVCQLLGELGTRRELHVHDLDPEVLIRQQAKSDAFPHAQ